MSKRRDLGASAGDPAAHRARRSGPLDGAILTRNEVARLKRIGIVAAAIGCIAALAAGDCEETERRLKAAGVDDALAARIRAAVARGSAWLAGRQGKEGGIGGRAGETALAALALRHCPDPASKEAFLRALRFMMAGGDRLRPEYLRGVYEGGLAAMCLAADGTHPRALAALAAAFAYGENGRGAWGYSNAGGGKGGGANLSTTQFAALALWAASRGGARIDPALWRRQVDLLAQTQPPDGSFGYGFSGHSYPNGTFMGLANLALAEAALAADPAAAPFVERSRSTRALAEFAFERDVPIALAAFREGWVRDYYGLWALEKACLFLDRETVGGVRWYVEGAKALCDLQAPDGRWPGTGYRYWVYYGGAEDRAPVPLSEIESTSFALLFLLRSWNTFHPTTPREVDAPVTTGGAPAPEAPAPPPVAPARIPLAAASAILRELEALLADPKSPNEALVRKVGEASEAHARVAPEASGDAGAAAVAAFRAEAQALFLRAFRLVRADLGRDRNLRSEVNVAAARALGATGAPVSAALREALSALHLRPKSHDPDGALLRAAFEALGDLGEEASLRWMLEEAMLSNGAADSDTIAEAALLGALRFRDPPGGLRFEVCDALVRTYASLERKSTLNERDSAAARERWRRLGRGAIRLLQQFTSVRGIPPFAPGPLGGWMLTVSDFERWLREHRDPSRPPWSDR